MKNSLYLLIIFLANFYILHASVFHRIKRDDFSSFDSLGGAGVGNNNQPQNNIFGDLLAQLSAVVQQITGPLTGNNKPSPQNDPSFSSGPGSAKEFHPAVSKSQSGPSFGDSVGYCKESPQMCEYLACKAGNFKNGPQGQNLKSGSKVLADPDLRDAVKNDPAILREACNKAGLNDNGCSNFKTILDLADKLDPKSAHTHDEPRNKRSPVNDYGNEAGAGGTSKTSGQSAGSASKSSGQAAASKSSNAGGSGKSHGTDYDYHDHGSSGGALKGSNTGAGIGEHEGGQPEKDCEALLPGNRNNRNNNGNHQQLNHNGRPRAQSRRVNGG